MFVEAYIGEANGNGVEAARIAGYTWPEKQAYQLLGKTWIKAQIARRVKSVAMSANEVLARISEIATSDIGEFIKVDSSGGFSLNLKRSQRTRLIRKIKQTRTTDKDDNETVTTDLEVRDPFPALVKLGSYHNLWDREPEPEVDMKAVARRMAERKKARGKPNNT